MTFYKMEEREGLKILSAIHNFLPGLSGYALMNVEG